MPTVNRTGPGPSLAAGDRIKGVNLVGINVTYNDIISQWATQFPNAIRPQLDLIKAAGLNTVRMTSGMGGIVDSVYTRATFQAAMQEYIEYCQSIGLYVYITAADSFTVTGTDAAMRNAMKAEALAFAAFLDPFPGVVAIDLWNEFFYNLTTYSMTFGQAVTMAIDWSTAARALTNIPLTWSLPTTQDNGSAAMWNSTSISQVTQLLPAIDFIDQHVYYDIPYTDITNYVHALDGIPIVIGEIGQRTIDGDATRAPRYASIDPVVRTWGLAGAMAWNSCDGVTYQDNDPTNFGIWKVDNPTHTLQGPWPLVLAAVQSWSSVFIMSDFLKDTFRGSNGTLLSAHAIDYGGTYQNYGGDPFIDGANRVKTNPGAIGYSIYSLTPPSADYAVEMQVTFLDINADQNFNLTSRVRVNGDRYVLNGYYDTGVFTLAMACFVSGSPTVIGTQIAFNSVGAPLAAGATYTFRLECAGTIITGFKDGTQIVSGSNSQISEAGWVGFQFAGANTNTTGLRISNMLAFPIGGKSPALSIANPSAGTVTSSSIQMLATAAAGGIPGYTYQWYRNNVLIAGATSLTLNDSGLSASTSYVYKIIATDAASDTVTSGTVSQQTSSSGGGGGNVPADELFTSFSNDTTQVSTYKMVMNLWLSANAGGYTGIAPRPSQTESVLLRQAVDITAYLAQ